MSGLSRSSIGVIILPIVLARDGIGSFDAV